MALVSAIVNRALRLLDAIDASAATPSSDSATAITVMNSMVTRWEANGLALGWLNVAAVDDTMPSPAEADEAIATNLAVMLGPEYPISSSFPIVVQMALSSLAELRRDRLTEMPLTLSTTLPCASRGRRFNIYTNGQT